MKNEDKNLEKDKRLDNLQPVPFTSENQPSPEAKSKGWERRREAQKILDEFMSKGEMTYKEIKELLDDIKAHPENHTLREVKIANYLMSQKYTIDWLDRHISKAPQEIDMTSKGEKINVVEVKFVGGLDDTGESGESPADSRDSGSQEDTPEGETGV
jgi:polyhydroxyalkanoate synthesis regulator phasin